MHYIKAGVTKHLNSEHPKHLNVGEKRALLFCNDRSYSKRWITSLDCLC